MRVSIQREIQIGDLLEEIEERFGGERQLENHLEENPRDWDARVALHDLREYRDEDPGKRIKDTRELVLQDSALDRLTFRRLELLVEIKQQGGTVDGIRRLARLLERDKKNVSADVEALREVGLLSVRRRGPGRAHEVRLPGEQIDLHLVEAGS